MVEVNSIELLKGEIRNCSNLSTSIYFNPLMANDTFKHHKRFHLLEKAQFSQEKVQTCENHQIRKADFGEKNSDFFGAPPALKRTHGGVHKKVSPLAAGFEGAQPPTLIVALVWLLRGRRWHQFVSLGGS